MRFKIVIGVFFGIAIIAAAFRVCSRFYLRRRLHLDDALLIFASVSLAAATGLLYYGTSAIYLVEALSVDPSIESGNIAGFIDNLQETFDETALFQKITWAYVALSYTTIFIVKLGFLSFFRELVKYWPRVNLYWKLVVVFTAICYVFAICDTFIACPKLGLAACKHSIAYTAEMYLHYHPDTCSRKKALVLGTVAISLDVLTDVLRESPAESSWTLF